MSPAAATKKKDEFDPNIFLATIGEGRKMVAVRKKQTIFAQGDEADAVFYIQKGKVRLTVVSKTGKEATIAILSEGNFFGEGSLAGQVRRMGSAAAMTACEVLRVEKVAMAAYYQLIPTIHQQLNSSEWSNYCDHSVTSVDVRLDQESHPEKHPAARRMSDARKTFPGANIARG